MNDLWKLRKAVRWSNSIDSLIIFGMSWKPLNLIKQVKFATAEIASDWSGMRLKVWTVAISAAQMAAIEVTCTLKNGSSMDHWY